jgi:hypothetical protein
MKSLLTSFASFCGQGACTYHFRSIALLSPYPVGSELNRRLFTIQVQCPSITLGNGPERCQVHYNLRFTCDIWGHESSILRNFVSEVYGRNGPALVITTYIGLRQSPTCAEVRESEGAGEHLYTPNRPPLIATRHHDQNVRPTPLTSPRLNSVHSTDSLSPFCQATELVSIHHPVQASESVMD